jgi:hypothetical protein
MLNNINPYNQTEFEKAFKTSRLYDKLSNDFDVVHFDPVWVLWDNGTTRQHSGDKKLQKTRFNAVCFYYLNFLLKENPKEIYDLGCGWNIFKKYIPSVIGLGAEDPNSEWFFGDIHDFVDDDYVAGHQHFFESVFAINSLHFFPLSEIRKRVLDFASMIRPSGKGYLALNLQRLLDLDPEKFAELGTAIRIEQYIRTELDDMSFNYEVFDLDVSRYDSGLDGNIRMVIKV